MGRLRWIIAIIMIVVTVIVAGFIVRHLRHQPVQEALELLPQNVDLALDDINYSQMENGETRWTLKSERAQYMRTTELVELTGVDLRFFSAERAGEVTLRADRGQFQEQTRQLDVYGNVIVTSAQNDVLTTEWLHYDDQVRRLSTPEPFEYVSPGMRLRGIGMRMDVDQERLMVEQDVSMRLSPDKED